MLLTLLPCVTLFSMVFALFFFTAPPPTEIYTLSLHDALPISDATRAARMARRSTRSCGPPCRHETRAARPPTRWRRRSEEHTSELQSRQYLVCRLLLEKKHSSQSRRRRRSSLLTDVNQRSLEP